MVEDYARVSDVVLVLVTSSPNATNIVTHVCTNAFHETDIVRISCIYIK